MRAVTERYSRIDVEGGHMSVTRSDVFVSYSHEDKKIASRIKEDLSSNKQAVWMDDKELGAGHPLIYSIQEAIRLTSNFVLLWSRNSSRSRWVNAEWYAAWSLEKRIIPCTLDEEPLPPFLLSVVWCSFVKTYKKGIEELLAALKRGGKAKRKIHPVRSGRSGYREISTGQNKVLSDLEVGDVVGARIEQTDLDKTVEAILKENTGDPNLLSLAAYQKKNAFQIKHWTQLQSRQYPKDKLLDEAEGLFYKSLAIDPANASATNGLGSILALRGDVDAAEFFVKRGIALARKEGIDYKYAEDDLHMIEQLKVGKI